MSRTIYSKDLNSATLSADEQRASVLAHCYGGYFAPRGDLLGGAKSIKLALEYGEIHRGIEPGTVVIGGTVYATEEAVKLGYLDHRAAVVMNTRNDKAMPRYVLEDEFLVPQPVTATPAAPTVPTSSEVIAAFMQSDSMLANLFQSNTKEITS